ncbi:MAG: hypothetical protein JST57_09370 [Bacteroidetes bacterium]|nr:hypothetical protein [Bacteroidota bacterium]
MLRQLTIFALLLFTLFSCQKEISFENGTNPTPTPPNNDSIYISKIVGLDTSKVAPLDTVYKYLLGYDISKRIQTAIMIDYNNTGIPVDTSWNLKYYYATSDTLPSKITAIGYSSFYDTVFYSYDTPTRNLISDSSVEISFNPPSSNIDALVYKYSYFPNWITTIEKRYSNNLLQSLDTYKVYLTKQNNNIVYQLDTLQTTFQDFIETFTVSYDSKPNPIKTVINSVPYYTFDNEYLLYGSSNNILEINNVRQNSLGSSVEHYKYTYEYNQLGYPKVAKLQNIGSTFPRPINKIKYYYTN